MDNKTSTLYCSPCVSTDLGQIEDLAASENQIILSKENLNLNNVQEIQHQSISNIAINDSDDESEKPTVSVVIDDDEAHISTENDQSEITSTTAEEIPSCFVDVLFIINIFVKLFFCLLRIMIILDFNLSIAQHQVILVIIMNLFLY